MTWFNLNTWMETSLLKNLSIQLTNIHPHFREAKTSLFLRLWETTRHTAVAHNRGDVVMSLRAVILATGLTLILGSCTSTDSNTDKSMKESETKETMVSNDWLLGKTLQDISLTNGVFSLVGSQMLGNQLSTSEKKVESSEGTMFVSIQVGVSITGKEKDNSIPFLEPRFKVLNEETNEEYKVMSVGTLNSNFNKQNGVINSAVTYHIVAEVPKDIALSGFNLTIYDSKDISQIAEKPLIVQVPPDDSHPELNSSDKAPKDKPHQDKTVDKGNTSK